MSDGVAFLVMNLISLSGGIILGWQVHGWHSERKDSHREEG
jgi:hypothetical protein